MTPHAARATARGRSRVVAAIVLAAPWALYLPLGLQYAAYLGLGLAATAALHGAGRLAQVPRQPLFVAVVAFWGWLAVSVAWSTAGRGDLVAHLWTYSLLLWAVPIALAVDADDARRALRHFVVASALVGAVWIAHAAGALAAFEGALPFVGADGNRRIAISLLLALGAAFGALFALDAAAPRTRAAWALAALVCAAGLALQDRRSGMVTLPAMLLALAVARQPTWPRRAGVAVAVAAAVGVAWLPLDGVRGRFAEGVAELRAYRADDDVATSWGMRLRMVQVTAGMVRERPLAGWGVGSWVSQWHARVPAGAVARHATPHNEYLLVAAQGGAVALALLAAVVAAALAAIRRRGRAAHPALLVVVTFVVAGAFNVVLRDTKFALPLLTLAALGGAAWRVALPPRRDA